MPPVTIKDIAKTAGLSIATVSYVINNSRPVSPEAAEKVKQAIYQLGYSPNLIARSLRSKRTSTIGLVVPDSSNPFFAEIAKGVEDAGFSASYSVILCNSNATLQREQVYLDLLISKRVDGLILASTSATLDHLRPLLQRQLPVVVFYRQAEDLPVDTIQVDNQKGGQDATRHLIQLGHQKIACIRPASAKTPSYHRVDGYVQAMLESGLEISTELMPQGNNRIEGGHAAALRLLDSGQPFSAIFSTNDAMAIGAMRALRERGLRVPEDVSVIGFDDILLASYVVPALTTITQPKVEAGKRAVEFLIERIESCGDCQPHHLVLETNFVARASTAPPPSKPGLRTTA
jgi:LacI family transcriptional regulator